MFLKSSEDMTLRARCGAKRVFLCFLGMGLFIFLCSSLLHASEWPYFQGDASRHGYTSSSVTPPLQQIYKITVGDLGLSSPIKIKNKIIVGTKGGKVAAYDAFNAGGIKLWEYQTGGAIDSTACASGGAVYVSSWDGNLYVLDEANGALLWTYQTGSTDLSSPVASGGVVYVGAGYPSNKLLAINTATRTVLWEHAMTQPVYSSPAVEGSAVYVGSNDAFFHKVDAATGSMLQMFDTAGSIYLSSPSVNNDILRGIGGDYSKNLYAVNMTSGQMIWQYATGTNTSGADDSLVKVSSPAMANGIVYVSAGFPTQKLYAVDAITGAEKWKKSLGSIGTTNVLSSPVVAGNVVYVGGANGTLYAFDAQNGSDLGTVVLDGPVLSTPAPASGMLYVTTTAGSLYAFRIGADKDAVAPAVSFDSPTQNQEVGNKVNINATVSDEHFKSVTLSYGAGASPAAFTESYTGYEELSNEKLTTWDTSALPEGTYTLKLSALDIVDNAKETAIAVNVSHRVPVLAVDSPADNLLTKLSSVVVSGTVDAGATVTVNGTPVTITSGAFQTTVALAEGVNAVSVVATNDIGNSIGITRNVTVDSANPVLTVSSPADNSVVNTSSVTVAGTATDASGIKQFLVNGQPVAIGADGAFSTSVNLSEGQNTVALSATDNADNTVSSSVKVTLDSTLPQITLNAPLDAASITVNNGTGFSVQGNVSETLVSLTLNGEAVSVGADLTFSKAFSLVEGNNTLTLVATDMGGNKTTVTRVVTLDTAKVALNLMSPADGAITNKKTIDVSGETEAGALLKVNGAVVAVDETGKFTTPVTLANENAKNTITVSASDTAGNETVVTRDVIHDSKPPKGNISVKLGGEGKVKTIMTENSVALQLDATDENGGVKMMVGTDEKFTGAAWEDFASAKTVALWKDGEYGKKKICVKFKDVVDNETDALCSDEMERVPAMLANTSLSVSADGDPDIIGEAGNFQLDLGKLPYAAAASGDVVIVKPDPAAVPAIDSTISDAIEIRFFGFSQSAKLSGSALARVPADLVMFYSAPESDDEKSYRIYMYRQSTGTWEKVPGFQEVDTLNNKIRATVQLVMNTSTLYRVVKDASVAPQQPASLSVQNYPNPVHGDTTFAYSLSAGIPTRVTIEVYNVKGKRVMYMEDPTPDDGKYTTAEVDTLANGVYFYKTTVYTSTETIVSSGKLVMLK